MTLPVWSQSEGKRVDVKVDAGRVPRLLYQFTPERGVLPTAGEWAWFDGLVGGVPFDMAAFAKRYLRNAYPSTQAKTAPEWKLEEGAPYLEFNGKGNFLYFPEEALPRGSFRLAFELRPTGEGPQILAVSRGYRVGAFRLELNEGHLEIHWLDGEGNATVLKSQQPLPLKQWNKVAISYSFDEMKLDINGTEERLPLAGEPITILTPFIFGGYGNGKAKGYFEGGLRAFRIDHTSQPPP